MTRVASTHRGGSGGAGVTRGSSGPSRSIARSMTRAAVSPVGKGYGDGVAAPTTPTVISGLAPGTPPEAIAGPNGPY